MKKINESETGVSKQSGQTHVESPGSIRKTSFGSHGITPESCCDREDSSRK